MIRFPKACTPSRAQTRRWAKWLAAAMALCAFFATLPAVQAKAGSGHFTGAMYWSGQAQLALTQSELTVAVPEVATRLELAYEHMSLDQIVRLRADARGTWGARPGFNAEQELSSSARIVEASVTTVNKWGEWTIGRHPMLLPFAPDDYRRFGLLLGNASAPADGLSWYRPLGPWELEAALAYIHVLRNPETGWLDRGDTWFAVRGASLRGGQGWQLRYAPTLVLSDAVDSHGWSMPFQLDTADHRIEGEVAMYKLTGTTLVPTGWYTAWLLRYQPIGLKLPLQSIEIASVPTYFLPHMANFGDRGGRLDWRPGERGVAFQFSTDIGQVGLAWRQIQRRGTSGELMPHDTWELRWSPRTLPKPLANASVSLVRVEERFELALRTGLGFRF